MRFKHKKHHLPIAALIAILVLLGCVIYFALFFQGGLLNNAEKIPEMYSPTSGLGEAEGGL